MEDNDIIDISMDFDNYASKFGGGVELLMNDKKQKKNEQTSDIDIEDLNNLENELNDLANESIPLSNTFESGLFGVQPNSDDNHSA